MVPESYHNLHSRDIKPIFHLATLFAQRKQNTATLLVKIGWRKNSLKEVKISRYTSMCHDLPHSRCVEKLVLHQLILCLSQ